LAILAAQFAFIAIQPCVKLNYEHLGEPVQAQAVLNHT